MDMDVVKTYQARLRGQSAVLFLEIRELTGYTLPLDQKLVLELQLAKPFLMRGPVYGTFVGVTGRQRINQDLLLGNFFQHPFLVCHLLHLIAILLTRMGTGRWSARANAHGYFFLVLLATVESEAIVVAVFQCAQKILLLTTTTVDVPRLRRHEHTANHPLASFTRGGRGVVGVLDQSRGSLVVDPIGCFVTH